MRHGAVDFSFRRIHLQNLDLFKDDAAIRSFIGLLADGAMN
jgi:hypothetical protein